MARFAPQQLREAFEFLRVRAGPLTIRGHRRGAPLPGGGMTRTPAQGPPRTRCARSLGNGPSEEFRQSPQAKFRGPQNSARCYEQWADTQTLNRGQFDLRLLAQRSGGATATSEDHGPNSSMNSASGSPRRPPQAPGPGGGGRSSRRGTCASASTLRHFKILQPYTTPQDALMTLGP